MQTPPLDTTTIVPSRRRGSTGGSTGLDCSSCLRVDNDISSRVRSLLLSRNDHCPPRTPYSSVEHLHDCLSDPEDVAGTFDFSTARSIAKQVRLETGRLSLPGPPKILQDGFAPVINSLNPEITGEIQTSLSKHPALGSTSSVNDLTDNAKILAAKLSCTPSRPLEAPEDNLKLPRIVLKDSRKGVVTVPPQRPTVISPGSSQLDEPEFRPRNISHTKSIKYAESMDRQNSVELLGYKYRAETSDIACFVNGCSPGPDECAKHLRFQSHRSKTMPSDADIIKSNSNEAARQPWGEEDTSTSATPFPKLTDGNFDKSYGAGADKYSLSNGRDGVAENLGLNSSAAPTLQSVRSSIASADAFPHALLSQQLVSQKAPVSTLSTTIVTNFVLPELKAPRTPLKKPAKQDAVKELSKPQVYISSANNIQSTPTENHDPCNSDVCKTCSPKNTSLHSSASRTSLYRHALLTPSILDTPSLDIGLPMLPVVSPLNSMRIHTVDNGLHQTSQKAPLKRQAPSALSKTTDGEVLKSPVSGHITDLQKAEELSIRVPEQFHYMSRNEHQGQGCNNHDSVPGGIPENPASWGFVQPGEDVDVEAPSASQRAMLASGNKTKKLEDDANSLAEAVHDADDYLQRSSQRNGHAFLSQGSATSVDLQNDRPRNSEKGFNNDTGCDDEGYNRQNTKFGRKMSKRWKKVETPDYGLIPERTSSRNRGTTQTVKNAKISSFQPAQAKQPRTSSVITLRSQHSPKLRSTSSLEVFRSSAIPPAPEPASASDAAWLHQFRSYETGGRKNTLHWLRELLTSSGPYEPRLTALPPRTRRLENSSIDPIRSHTAPIIPVEQLFLTETPYSLNIDKSKHDSAPGGNLGAGKKPSVTEAFSKTICDLEDLLNEALHIAKQAADHQETEHVCGKVNIDKHRETQHSDDASNVGSVHESLLFVSDSNFSNASEDDGSYDEDFEIESRNIKAPSNQKLAVSTLDKEDTTRRGSEWPPTGWASTPFPPAFFSHASGSPKKLSGSAGVAKDNEAESVTSSDFVISIVSAKFRDVDPFNGRGTGGQPASNKVSPGNVSPSPATGKNEDGKHEWRRDIADCRARARSTGLFPLRQSSLLRTVSGPDRKRESPTGAVLSKPESSNRIVRGQTFAWQDVDHTKIESCPKLHSKSAQSTSSLPGAASLFLGQSNHSHSFDRSCQPESKEIQWYHNNQTRQAAGGTDMQASYEAVELRDVSTANLPEVPRKRTPHQRHIIDLKGRSHVSLLDHEGFGLSRSHKRQAIARDWSPARKRFCATVACISTALVGILVGIYAGEVPAIQYYVVDFHHSVILGNVLFFLGLAIPTFFFWPLPLLHGRKPYILGAMSLAMPLLFPQALAVGDFRSPYEIKWRICLLLPRALMGFCLGFANMNFKSTLTDLFGASLQSLKPHQEIVDEFDVRRHGGGMGVWLGIWTWCCIGSIGIGFLIGAVIINHLNPAWGFYASICIIAGVLLLNVVSPEVRRSAYRRSIAAVKNGDQISRRLARGEVKMHMVQTGPKWWGEEFYYGVVLSMNMLRQPGFLIMSFYVAWMYGQMVLIIVLLGSLTSKRYNFKSPFVGLSVAAVPVGALLSVPFQKASLFSRSRKARQDTDDETLTKKLHWSSHMVRRAIFMLVLPFAGLAYTLTSTGPPLPFILPIIFAGLMGFLSNLAMAECHGIIMETFDTSDLQPGMTGRPRGVSGDLTAVKRTNYSSFPRVTSAVAITEGMGYLLGAAATGVGGVAQRHLGQQASTSVMAGILLILSFLLLGVLIRFKEVQIIPNCKAEELEKWRTARRASLVRRKSGLEVRLNDEPWRPVIIGNPSHSMRRMCVLELGSLSRFSEIRKKNRLIDQESLEARHPNLAALGSVKRKLREKEAEVRQNVQRNVSREGAKNVRSLKGLGSRFSGDVDKGREMGGMEGRIDEEVMKKEDARLGVSNGKRRGRRNRHGREGNAEQVSDTGGLREMGVQVDRRYPLSGAEQGEDRRRVRVGGKEGKGYGRARE